MKNSVTIAIVDDDVIFRSILIAYLKKTIKNIKIIIEVSNGLEFIDALQKGKTPEIVILDLEMPVMDGIKTTEYLSEKYPNCKILILTGHNNLELLKYLIQKGANSFIPKNIGFPKIIEAVYSVKNTGYYFANIDLKKIVVANMLNRNYPSSFLEDIFSKREKEVICLICQQYTNKEISQKLFISSRTVDGHRNKLMEKANVRNTAGIVMFAIKHGIVTPDNY